MSLGLYLHFPFCRNLCSYCDFYKEPYAAERECLFFDALRLETECVLDAYAASHPTVSTLFIGGGTPSLANLDLLAQWLKQLQRGFKFADNLEFSIETNPESVTRARLEHLKDLGVNRPVFGIQSFNRRLLSILNRRHNPHHSYRAVYYANALGFENFGTDLIFGLPHQNSQMLSTDLDQLLELKPPHVSFYQLTVEPGTPLATRVASGDIRLPDAELSLGLYRGGVERLADAGYVRYEVSSFAKPGFECRHNLGYWEGDDYIGLGPSAHSFINNTRFCNSPDLGRYMSELQAGRWPREIDDSGYEERMVEAVMLGLRMEKGISRTAFSRRFGRPLETALNTQQYRLLIESGHLIPDRGSLRLSDQGMLVADEITRRLLK